MENNAPIKKFRAIGGMAVSVWSNKVTREDGSERDFKTVNLERRYKDKDGNWKNGNSFTMDDIPKAAALLNKAYEYLAILEDNQDTLN